MKQQTISFSYNWNNKLDCKSFTTVRIYNEKKYVINQKYSIELCGNLKKEAIIVNIKSFTVNNVNDYISYLDSGYSLEEFKNVLFRMYPHVRKDSNQKFMFILLSTIK